MMLACVLMDDGLTARLLGTFGTLIFLDDLVSHLLDRPFILHTLYSKIYHKWGFVRTINSWFDRFFGKV